MTTKAAAPQLPDLARPAAGQPKAAMDQLDVQPFESGLLELARVHHPTVSWWHGYRRAQDRFGSYCYVCDEFIVTWAGNSGPPKTAVVTIDAHKMHHRDGTTPTAKPTSTKRGKR